MDNIQNIHEPKCMLLAMLINYYFMTSHTRYQIVITDFDFLINRARYKIYDLNVSYTPLINTIIWYEPYCTL